MFETLTEDQVGKCIESSAVTTKDLELVDVNSDTFEPKVMCFAKCLFEETKIIDSDGNVQMEIVKSRQVSEVDNPMNQKFEECIGQVKVIKECSDLQQVHDCMKS